MSRARRETAEIIPLRHAPGRPPDTATRQRILDARRDHPELRTHDEIAAYVGCSRRLVASVLPPLKPPRGTRVVVPAELVAWALEHVGGRDPARAVIRVLEAARRAAQVGG